LRQEFAQAEIIPNEQPQLRTYIRALRPHQWTKNGLVFLPMIAGHHFDLMSIISTLVAFISFSAAASSAYLINDVLDVAADRRHPTKARRPFAAGLIPVSRGILLSAMLMAASVSISLFLPVRFLFVLTAYVVATLSYSILLKRILILDVVTLGGLYTLRVLAGLAATTTLQPPWLLMFSLFIFLCLAIVKRCSEIKLKQAAGQTEILGRSYRFDDLGVLLALAAAAGYGSVLIVCLYLDSATVGGLYRHVKRLWLICPLLLYWISRVLVLAQRGQVNDDPVVFAITDRVSWCVAAAVGAVIAISI
jgi:4-hydroxybenzoate polyprenyltransferase